MRLTRDLLPIGLAIAAGLPFRAAAQADHILVDDGGSGFAPSAVKIDSGSSNQLVPTTTNANLKLAGNGTGIVDFTTNGRIHTASTNTARNLTFTNGSASGGFVAGIDASQNGGIWHTEPGKKLYAGVNALELLTLSHTISTTDYQFKVNPGGGAH